MHLKELLVRFNISHFIFYCALLLLAVLIGLRADDVISVPYGVVFLPLWIWYGLVITGVILGIVRWTRSKEQRQEDVYIYQFKSMIISASLQFLVFLTELLIAINIDTQDSIPWSVVFVPMYILSIVSIPTCIWNCYRKRSIEIELLSMTSFIQFIFLSIKLDSAVNWKWAIILIPLWLLYCAFISGLIVLAVITLLAYILGENQQEMEDRKLPDILFFVCSALFSIFIIIFMSLLVSRLDGNISTPYSAIMVPLYIALFILLSSTLSRRPANIWWYGIRKNFVDLSLDCCPFLQEYANVSYHKVRWDIETGRPREEGEKRKDMKLNIEMDDEFEYPYEDIYMPD